MLETLIVLGSPRLPFALTGHKGAKLGDVVLLLLSKRLELVGTHRRKASFRNRLLLIPVEDSAALPPGRPMPPHRRPFPATRVATGGTALNPSRVDGRARSRGS